MTTLQTEFTVIRTCPACESPEIQPYRKGTFRPSSLTEEQIRITDSQYGKVWDLSLCRACGHLFANPSPSPDLVFSLYSHVEDPEYEEEATGRSKNFCRLLGHLEKHSPGKGILFDVGAATGILLCLARRRGWEVDGIEPSAWAVKVAREKYGLRLREGFFEAAPLEENRYNAVTMIDFIEHTPIPLRAIKKASEILRPSGILCLVTPDIHSPAARIAGRRWWHLRPAHLAFFSRHSLSVLLRRVGLSIIQERRYAWTFSLHYLLSRKKQSRFLLGSSSFSSLLKKIPIKLALGDSYEIYARKEQ